MRLELKPGLTLYFARHGETIANVEHRFQGHNDTPLTERGRTQARMIAAILGADPRSTSLCPDSLQARFRARAP